jgi:hypothetical protein
MTHEVLAVMLCVHRPGVTIRLLQRACVISYGQGQITVTDRAGIEAAACECCGAVRGQVERLPGFALGRARGAGPPPPPP